MPCQVFPDHHKWAFDPPEPPLPARGTSPPVSPSKAHKPPFLSPQKYKNHFLKPVDQAAIWQQEVCPPPAAASRRKQRPRCDAQVNVAGKVTGVYMPIIKRQPGTDKIPSCAACSPRARERGGGDAPARAGISMTRAPITSTSLPYQR